MKTTAIPSDLSKPSQINSFLSNFSDELSSRNLQTNFIHYMCLFVICINPLLGFLNFWHSNTLYGVISLVALTILILNKSGIFNIARIAFITGLNLLMFSTSAAGGEIVFVCICFTFCIVADLLLFSKKERWSMSWSIAISILLLSIAIWSGYRFPIDKTETDDLFDTSSIINIGCTLISVIVAIYYLLAIYEKTEGNLRLLVRQLQAQEQAIQLQNQQLVALNGSLMQSQEELLKNQAFLNTIIDHLPVMLSVKDVKNLKLLRVNKAMEALTKYDEAELLNRKNSDIFPHEQAEQFTTSDLEVLNENRTKEKEEYITDKQNKTHIINTKRVPVHSPSGEMLYLLSLSEDITQRKRNEQVLNNTLEELRIRNHELDNYVYRVSHDLRSPLCSILGLVSLIKNEEDSNTVRDYILMIESTVVKSDYFIQSILDHSKMLHAELQVTEIDFKKMIEECFNELKFIVNFEKIGLEISQRNMERFFNDEFRITTIFRNLISNSLRYADPKKSDKQIKFSIETSEKQAIITLEDNGIGIEEKYIDRIFDMFFRGSERSSGSGLGLYIVKQAIDKMEGNISVKSMPNVGTRFVLVIPNKKSNYLLL